MKVQPSGDKQTGRKMEPCDKYGEKIMENTPTAFKGLKGIGDVQQRLEKQKQSQTHKLQFQAVVRKVVARDNVQLAQTKKHGVQSRKISDGMQAKIRERVFDTAQGRQQFRAVPIHIVHQNSVLDDA